NRITASRHRLRKVTLTFQGCGHGESLQGAGIALIAILIVEEEKYLILKPASQRNRPADAAAADSIPVDRFRNAVLIVEESVCVQILVAEIGIHSTVKLLGAGSGYQIDNRSGASAVFGLVVGGLHVDLDQRVCRGGRIKL